VVGTMGMPHPDWFFSREDLAKLFIFPSLESRLILLPPKYLRLRVWVTVPGLIYLLDGWILLVIGNILLYLFWLILAWHGFFQIWVYLLLLAFKFRLLRIQFSLSYSVTVCHCQWGQFPVDTKQLDLVFISFSS
jgi:hypothetical protein